MIFKQRNLFFVIVLIHLSGKYFKLTQANSIFRFGFDFGLNLNENSFKTSFKIGDNEESKEITTAKYSSYFTESPATVVSPVLTDIWSKQAQLYATAHDKLQATRVAVTQLKNEILVVVGRSDFIAAKVKLMTRYLNKVNTVLANNTADTSSTATAAANNDNGAVAVVGGHDNDAAANRFLILQDYVQLVDDLRAPPTSAEGGERSLDYMVMKLGLEKHKLIELQTQILLEVLQAMETWQTYVKKQLVDVVTV
ncbi:hypothetical protein FF38_04350 [Lucilia cuprina]|uniref:Uncharacterized protein n=1 Tax=Lucilia cuprina TaxID=7375 RepID=A0A0L0C6U3_LUCCU|nr:hypothetical protein CVS40_1558 [Lucilia cuprina]KNC28133.1 hypothetical protein FF38_04350 [Lucilia cuprina]